MVGRSRVAVDVYRQTELLRVGRTANYDTPAVPTEVALHRTFRGFREDQDDTFRLGTGHRVAT